MAILSVQVEGLKELDAFMGRELSKAAAVGAMSRALVAAAQPMAAKARSMAPDDPNTIDLSRELSESIVASTRAKGSSAEQAKSAFGQVVSSGGSQSAARSAARAARATGAFVEAFVGPVKQVFHGIFQEFGTVHHGPRPFLRPAFDSDKMAMIGRLKNALAIEVSEAASRARKVR